MDPFLDAVRRETRARSSDSKAPKGVPPRFTALLRASLSDVDASPSRAQVDVANSLQALGLDVAHEHVLPEGLSVDVALLPLKWRVAVEFDGPRHYFLSLIHI